MMLPCLGTFGWQTFSRPEIIRFMKLSMQQNGSSFSKTLNPKLLMTFQNGWFGLNPDLCTFNPLACIACHANGTPNPKTGTLGPEHLKFESRAHVGPKFELERAWARGWHLATPPCHLASWHALHALQVEPPTLNPEPWALNI